MLFYDGLFVNNDNVLRFFGLRFFDSAQNDNLGSFVKRLLVLSKN